MAEGAAATTERCARNSVLTWEARPPHNQCPTTRPDQSCPSDLAYCISPRHMSAEQYISPVTAAKGRHQLQPSPSGGRRRMNAQGRVPYLCLVQRCSTTADSTSCCRHSPYTSHRVRRRHVLRSQTPTLVVFIMIYMELARVGTVVTGHGAVYPCSCPVERQAHVCALSSSAVILQPFLGVYLLMVKRKMRHMAHLCRCAVKSFDSTEASKGPGSMGATMSNCQTIAAAGSCRLAAVMSV